MCYSAMIKANLKSLSMQFGARVQIDAFEDLFEQRLMGSGARIPRFFEDHFIRAHGQGEERVQDSILKWREIEASHLKEEIRIQSERLEVAERKLILKETKTALNEKRIAGKKIAHFKDKLSELLSDQEEESHRMFPFTYAPLIMMENGERVIRPFRYHLRPRNEPESFDRSFDGAYNVRRDRLKEVFWWKSLYGKNHGILVVSSFFENVKLKSGENEVIEFTPQSKRDLLVPCLFDHNEESAFALDSFALITDEPNPEVLQAGHDRTPIFIKTELMNDWLMTNTTDLKKFDQVLQNKEPTYFESAAIGKLGI